MTHTATCSACAGTGHRPLRRAEWMTLAVLDASEWRTTVAIASALGLTPQAAIGRLRRLEAIGMVASRLPVQHHRQFGAPTLEWQLAEGVSK